MLYRSLAAACLVVGAEAFVAPLASRATSQSVVVGAAPVAELSTTFGAAARVELSAIVMELDPGASAGLDPEASGCSPLPCFASTLRAR